MTRLDAIVPGVDRCLWSSVVAAVRRRRAEVEAAHDQRPERVRGRGRLRRRQRRQARHRLGRHLVSGSRLEAVSRSRRRARSAPTTTISRPCRSTSTATAIPTSSRARTSARTSAGSRTPGKPAQPGPITRSTSRATSRRPGWSTSPGDGVPDVLPNTVNVVVWYEVVKKADGKGFDLKKHDFGTAAAGHGVGSGDVNGDGRIDLLTPKGWFEAPADPAHDTWAWHPDWQLGATGIQILARDVDGDGLSDVVYGMGHDYGLFWLHRPRAPAASGPGPSRRSTSRSPRSMRSCGPTSTATARPTSW